MKKHTPEPWAVERIHDVDAIAWVGQFAVLPVDHATMVVRGNTEDDARRIVACVNACAGLETEVLDNIVTLGETLLDRFELRNRQEKEIKAQRDELLSALEAAIACGMVPTSSAKEGGAMHYVRQAHVADHVADQIRAAIAKAKGV